MLSFYRNCVSRVNLLVIPLLNLTNDGQSFLDGYFIGLPCRAITAQKTDSRRYLPSDLASIMDLHTDGSKYLVVGWKVICCKYVG